jgi:pimeloyl-ACP methyl ester carboxylesterase
MNRFFPVFLHPRSSRPFPGTMTTVFAIAAIVGHGSALTTAEEQIPAERLSLTTTDGVGLAAWYYPVPGDVTPKATVIVIHELGGSHETVEPLSRGLQAAGFAVVAPDLRGHGASITSVLPGGRSVDLEATSMRKPDLLAIAASSGGRIRQQALARGDIETVHRWIEEQSDAGVLAVDRLCIVGCGEGGTLGALWTVADASWPPTTSGPQGGHVQAIVLISPAWMAKGGVSILPALKTDVFRRTLPILLLSGNRDRDAKKLADQFKGMRPKAWMVQGPGQQREQAAGVETASDASIFCMHADSPLSGDKLASDAAAKVPAIVSSFLDLVLGR